MSARDEAVAYTADLFQLIFKRLRLPFGKQGVRIVSKLIDLIIQAVLEAIRHDGDVSQELAALDPASPSSPPSVARSEPQMHRQRPPAIPHEVR